MASACQVLYIGNRPLSIVDQKVKDKIEGIKFASVTARLMKLKNADAGCEDYGQAVIYKGGVAGMERVFKLDTSLWKYIGDADRYAFCILFRDHWRWQKSFRSIP